MEMPEYNKKFIPIGYSRLFYQNVAAQVPKKVQGNGGFVYIKEHISGCNMGENVV